MNKQSQQVVIILVTPNIEKDRYPSNVGCPVVLEWKHFREYGNGRLLHTLLSVITLTLKVARNMHDAQLPFH